MTLDRSRTAVVLVTLCGALAAMLTPGSAVAGADAVAAAPSAVEERRAGVSRVSTRCPGGGQITMRVTDQPATDTVQITATTRNLRTEDRWRGEFFYEDESGDQFVSFRARAQDGGWSRSTEIDDSDVFAVFATSRSGVCIVLEVPGPPVFGVGFCSPRLVGLMFVSRRPRNDETVSQFMVFGPRPDSRWRVTVKAVSDGQPRSVTVGDQASRRGMVRVRASFSGPSDLRFGAVAKRPSGQRCRLGLSPEVITRETASRQELRASVELVRTLAENLRAR